MIRLTAGVDKPKRILIVRLSSIGDVLLTTPVIKILRQNHPESYLAYLVEAKSKDMITDNPYLDETIVFDKGKFKEVRKQEGLISALKRLSPLISKLRERNFDLVIDLHSIFRSTMLSYFTSAKQRIGIDKQMISILYTDTKEERIDLHVVDEYLNLLNLIDIDPVQYKKEFTIATSGQDTENVQKLLQKYEITNSESLIALNPATSRDDKDWSEVKFAKVGDWINHNVAAEVLILGGPADRAKTTRIVNQMETEALNLAGETSLKELVELLKHLDLLITGDTGPMHMAMAIETPLLALFGPTSPARYGPYQGPNLVLNSSGDNIDEIEVESVVERVVELIE